MKRFLLIFLILITGSVFGFAQSQYLAPGYNGTWVKLSSGFRESRISSLYIDAGYSIGGRIGLAIQGGMLVQEIAGVNEVVPNVSFKFGAVILKQRKAVPFSLKTDLRVGFSSALPDNRVIFGTNYGFNLLLTYNIPIKNRFFIGLNGLFSYDRFKFTITNNSTDPATVTESPTHYVTFGPAVDIGFRYHEDNMVILRTDLLWDLDAVITLKFNLLIVIPSTK